MTSILAWFDPTTGVATTGSTLNTWTDRINAWVGTPTGGSSPTYSTTSMNGFPGVNGTNPGTSANGTDVIATSLGSTVPKSIIAIGNATTGKTCTVAGSVNTGGLQARIDTSGTLTMNKETVAAIATSTSGGANGGYAIYVFTCGTSTYSFRINGNAAGSGSHAVASINGSSTDLMRNATFNGENFDGPIGDIIFTSIESATSELQQAEGYLAWKYSLASLLPAGHPYKSAAP
jgi:hypothetical protein